MILCTMISKIENIFETHSICKSIFVCRIHEFQTYYTILKHKDYPICKISKIDKFNNNFYRILLIDEYDAKNFTLLQNDLRMQDINLVLYINVNELINSISYIKFIVI